MLCAGSADTPELGAEVEAKVAELKATREGVFWIEQMLPKPEVIQILSHATVFACPSIYEPLGIVNLEAMACEAAVVATATGGIVEVVVDGETGFLVPIEPGDDGTGAPRDPDKFAADFAERVNTLLADPERAREFGKAGRRRAVESFAWPAIAAADLGALSQPRLTDHVAQRLAGRVGAQLLDGELHRAGLGLVAVARVVAGDRQHAGRRPQRVLRRAAAPGRSRRARRAGAAV